MARFAYKMGLVFLVATACIGMSARLSAGQTAPAPAPDCTSDLVQLFPCLDFLTNSSVSSVLPTCCSALTDVATSAPYCICQLISPAFSNQSAQLGINETRALQLPGFCSLNLSPSNCAVILGGPSTAPAPLAPVPVSAPAPTVVAAPAPRAATPASSPQTSAAPGPAVDCNSEIASLQGCVSFLSGTESSPSTSCCTNLGSVVSTAPQCLCTLADSSAITAVNITLVQELPQLCSVPVSIGQCANVGAAPSALPTGSEGPGSSPGDNNHGARSAASPSVYLLIALGLIASSHALFH